MQQINLQREGYATPIVEIIEVPTENGFAASTGDLPITDWGDGEIDWWADEA